MKRRSSLAAVAVILGGTLAASAPARAATPFSRIGTGPAANSIAPGVEFNVDRQPYREHRVRREERRQLELYRRAAAASPRDYLLAATQMVTDHRATPPEVLRAIFRFLSGRPGIKLVGDVVDPLGRPGKAVAVDGDQDSHEGIGVELIVDPETGKPPAFVHYRDGDVNRPWLELTRVEAVVRGTK